MAGDLKVAIDPADLAEAIGNVLDNATKWANAVIAVTAGRRGERVVLVVADDGPGVDESQYDDILKRGNHAEDEAGGSGLGLAITRDIAEAYGASVVPGRSGLGGLEITLDLPVKPPRRTVPRPV